MARYIGPKTKIACRFGELIFGPDKAFSIRNSSSSRRKKKTSEYGIQLREKQKAKYIYGVLENQFRGFFEKASRSRGITGVVLLQLLESRLDNLVYRMGLAKTRAEARQLVSHKHITIDNNVVNIPSYLVKPGQIIGVRERAKSLEIILDNLIRANHNRYSWIEYDKSSMSARYLYIPERMDIPENIKEQLIVELYSK